MPRVIWTKERIALTAERYSTLSMFQHNAKGAYNAAIRNNCLDEVTKHMKPNRQKWSKGRIIELAKTFSSIADFRYNESSAYSTAKANGWLMEATSHMTPLNIKWTDQMIIEEAKKYKTRREFELKSPSACTTARARKLMDIACVHMNRVGNYFKRLVYVYEFPDNSAYIGLTYNKQIRHNDHMSKLKSPVHKKILELKIEPQMKIISDSYIDAESARILEEETINSYKAKGWLVLNSIKAGGLGGTKTEGEKLYKDKGACHLESLKYSNKTEFRKNNPYAYRRAYELQCLEEICSHMQSRSFSYKDCELEAKKYKCISDFVNNSGKHFHRAHRKGWIDEICSHMNRYKKWTKQLVAEEAIKYSTRGEFAEKSGSAYRFARVNNILDEICKHMTPILIKWTKEMVIAEVEKYESQKDFRLLSPKAYEAARHNGWYEEVTSELKKIKKSPRI